MYLVGGAVRDLKLGLRPKDLDFTVVEPSFDHMLGFLDTLDVEIYLIEPDFGTVRGKFPKNAGDFAGIVLSNKACDFVLARKESRYSDGRRPDSVSPGTLDDDLARRDFTVNAMALDFNGDLYDPWNGAEDLRNMVLRAVGDPHERLLEDALRVVRAIRFVITKGFSLDSELVDAFSWSDVRHSLRVNISEERIREELLRCFQHDTLATLNLLNRFPGIRDILLGDRLWLMPTLKGK